MEIKIGDFGLATRLDYDGERKLYASFHVQSGTIKRKLVMRKVKRCHYILARNVTNVDHLFKFLRHQTRNKICNTVVIKDHTTTLNPLLHCLVASFLLASTNDRVVLCHPVENCDIAVGYALS